MEQLLSFLALIILLVIAVTFKLPLLFIVSFVGGVTYHVIRGKVKGWKLPKQIKDTHSW